MSGDKDGRQGACHRKISSNGLVSRKHESHTSLTTFIACASSLHCGLARTDKAALLLTQSWWWFVNLNILFLKNSFAHLNSPLRLLARICIALSAPRPQPFNIFPIRTSVQATCLKSCASQSTLNLKWSYACTISCAI